MHISSLKSFMKEVKETLKASKDPYIYLAIVLTTFILLLSLVFDYFISGIIVILLYAVVSPFLMAIASYFVAPSKQPLEQKQKYFFRLVKQFYRLDSMRIMIPLRTFLFAALFSMLAYYFAATSVVIYMNNFDPVMLSIIDEFAILVQNGASMDALLEYFNTNTALLQPYLFIAELVMIFTFVLSFSYMLIKRFFFVYLHVNLFTKTRLKVDMLKAKYYNGTFSRTTMRRYYFPSVMIVFILASLAYFATAIPFYILLGDHFNHVLIFVASASIYVIVLALSLPHLLTVNLVLFGMFMEQHALSIYQESIDDINANINNPQLPHQEKQRLSEIKKILEMQKVIFQQNLKKTNEENKDISEQKEDVDQ